jgi:hypothetical protein
VPPSRWAWWTRATISGAPLKSHGSAGAETMYLTQKQMSRRTVLKAAGVTMALPFLEAMVPARASAQAARGKVRFAAIEMVHGSAGSTAFGIKKNMWAPAEVGRAFDLSPSSLAPLEPFRNDITIISNTDVRNAEAFTAPEIGGDHFRSSAVFLTQMHPKQTQGSDVFVGTSLDQYYAQRSGQSTAIPSMQLCIENVDQAGGCSYGYSCTYTDSISWAAPDQPLPMVRDPRTVFDLLFGVGATPAERRERRAEDKSILDWLGDAVARMNKNLGAADRARLADYLEDVRELPGAPIGVPDDFAEHVKLMFDLQALAFASDTTRVFAFKMGRDASNRVYPDSGYKAAFHSASHHQDRDERITEFAKINKYHVSMLPYFLNKLKNTPDGDSNLLDNTLLIYGSPMGNSNVHNHKRCPLFLAGHAGGRLKGGVHLRAADGTPMANVMLSVAHMLGMDDFKNFGDSTAPMDLNTVPSTTAAI